MNWLGWLSKLRVYFVTPFYEVPTVEVFIYKKHKGNKVRACKESNFLEWQQQRRSVLSSAAFPLAPYQWRQIRWPSKLRAFRYSLLIQQFQSSQNLNLVTCLALLRQMSSSQGIKIDSYTRLSPLPHLLLHHQRRFPLQMLVNPIPSSVNYSPLKH